MDSHDQQTGDQATAEAARRLQQWPSLEDTEAQMRAVVEQIAAAASELVPGLKWDWVDDRLRDDSCIEPFDRTAGQMMNLQNYWARQPIPDDQWPQFLDRARAIAATVGATAPDAMQNHPGKHDIWFSNPADGATIKIATSAATVISARTGCRLPHDQS
ncbi:LppA family lipoprotein [Nocardia thraciensis]